LKRELGQLQNEKIDNVRNEIEELESNLERIKSEFSQKQSNRSAFEHELDLQENNLDAKRREKESLRMKYAQEEEESERLNSRLADLQMKIEQHEKSKIQVIPLQEELNTLTQSISAKGDEILRSKLSHQDILDHKDQALGKLKGIEVQIQLKQQEILSLDENLRLEEEKSQKYRQELDHAPENKPADDNSHIDQYNDYIQKVNAIAEKKYREFQEILDNLAKKKILVQEELRDATEKLTANSDEHLRHSQEDIKFGSFDMGEDTASEIEGIKSLITKKNRELNIIDQQLNKNLSGQFSSPLTENLDEREIENLISVSRSQIITLDNTFNKYQNSRKRYRDELNDKTKPVLSGGDYNDIMTIISGMESLFPDYKAEIFVDDPEERLRGLKTHLEDHHMDELVTTNFQLGSRVVCIPHMNQYYYLYNTDGVNRYILSAEILQYYQDQVQKKETIFGEIVVMEEKNSKAKKSIWSSTRINLL